MQGLNLLKFSFYRDEILATNTLRQALFFALVSMFLSSWEAPFKPQTNFV